MGCNLVIKNQGKNKRKESATSWVDLLSGCTLTDKEQEAAVATLGSEGSSADVRLGGAGSGDSARRTDTTVPVLGGGKGGKGRSSSEMLRPAQQGDARGGRGELGDDRHGRRRWSWRRSGRRLGEEASRHGAWVAMAQPLRGGSARGGSTSGGAQRRLRRHWSMTQRGGEKDSVAAALTRQHLQRLENGSAT
jgi:hypothetical protein